MEVLFKELWDSYQTVAWKTLKSFWPSSISIGTWKRSNHDECLYSFQLWLAGY